MQAVELNGTSVALNKAAFLWGRRAAFNRSKVEALVAQGQLGHPPVQAALTLEETLAHRTAYLTDYHDARYAQQYRQRVETFAVLERNICGSPGALTEAVARNYFKVLAIKDEYEVARLHSAPEFLERISGEFEGDVQLRFHLAPPLFGNDKKIGFGSWILKAFKLLAMTRRIRNTWLDPFARTHERKTELAWLHEYEQVLDVVASGLEAHKVPLAVKLCELPESVRGYGKVKARYLENARATLQSTLQDWDRVAATPIVVEPTIAVKQL